MEYLVIINTLKTMVIFYMVTIAALAIHTYIRDIL